MPFLNVYFNGVLQEQVELTKGFTTIGRGAESDIRINNPGVSAFHARVVQEGESYFIEDAYSTNGTSVNGEPVSRKQLEYGDMIGIFKHMLKFTPLETQVEARKDARRDSDLVDGSGTVDIDVSHLDKLLKHQTPVHNGYLLIRDKDGRQRKRPLNKQTFSIGKDPLSDFVVKGWFVPRSVANIDRRVDGFYFVPGKRGQVLMNGKRMRGETKLEDKDTFSFRRVSIQFIVDKPEKKTEGT